MNNNYMETSMGWGSKTTHTANRIDMVADKIKFVSEMIENNLLALDGVEKELQAYARGTTPPPPAMLIALAGRIDSTQSQLNHGLRKLQELTKEVDMATDLLQTNTGWK